MESKILKFDFCKTCCLKLKCLYAIKSLCVASNGN